MAVEEEVAGFRQDRVPEPEEEAGPGILPPPQRERVPLRGQRPGAALEFGAPGRRELIPDREAALAGDGEHVLV